MQPRVTAILVARNGSEFLEHTLAALRSQTTPPDATVFVDAASSDNTAQLLANEGPTQFVSDTGRRGFGGAVAHGLQLAPPATSENDWIWLLSQDSAPHPRALENLLAAVEIAPSVAIAGPKLMRWDRPDTISEYGESITRLGSSVALVDDELDQAQHDVGSDLLGVAAVGMLVRRSVWAALSGFDPALPSVDAALDFSIRARLAGHRVVGVPSARILSSGGAELFGRSSISAGATSTLRRSAQLHRRLVYSRAVLIPLHWLSLLPLAILRSIVHLIFKRPSSIGGEFRAAFRAAFSRSVGPARRNLNRSRRLGWASISSLRISRAQARELRAGAQRATSGGVPVVVRTRAGFFSGGGAWSVLIAGVIGVIAFSPLLGDSALSGGALAPLSERVSQLWANVGYGWHEVGGGFVGAADPFSFVLAVLGSATAWSPSMSIVLLYLTALPLAALAAWWCAVHFTERTWPPAVAALLWAFAPPFWSSLTTGHLGAVVAHLLLPWFVMAVLAAARSWSAGAAAALLLAAITAAAPSLAPALVLVLVLWMVVRPSRIPRLFGVFIPAAALFGPLVFDQIRRGTWAAWIVDPGIVVPTGATQGFHLALGAPNALLNGWSAAVTSLGLPDGAAPIIAAALLAPLAILALTALFLPGSSRAVPALLLALLGFATAVLGIQLELSFAGSDAVSIWPGAGLSLFWLGLTGAAVIGLDALGRVVVAPSLVVVLAALLAVGPLLAAPLGGTADVVASGTTATLPAFVAAETSTDPTLGTLQIDPQEDGALALTLHRGNGTTLDETSTLANTSTEISDNQAELADLAGNLASRSGLDIRAALDAQHIGFVLVTAGEGDVAAAAATRVTAALDANAALTPIGQTTSGRLWHFQEVSDEVAPAGKDAVDTPLGIGILVGQGFIFFVTVLLAVPTGRSRGRSTVADTGESAPGFDEDDNA
jgi:GT2 family glycosyltransferase